MTYGEGLEVAERDLLATEVGKQPQSLPDQVIAVVRDEKVHRYFDPVVSLLARGDKLVVVRPAEELRVEIAKVMRFRQGGDPDRLHQRERRCLFWGLC